MMTDKDPVVKGIEKILELLPDNLTEDEKAKVEEIQELLGKIDSSSKKRGENTRDDR